MDSNISKHFIFRVFCSLQIGYIESIREIYLKGNPAFKRIIIFIKWNGSERANFILDRLTAGKNIKVVYSTPWYWICLPNRMRRHDSGGGLIGINDSQVISDHGM